MVIVYHYKINEQTHYTFHDSEVCSISVSKSGMCASGERGKNPALHVWSVKDLKPVSIFKGQHKADIYLLSFAHKDQYLVSCSKRLDTPIIVFNLLENTVLFSTYVDQFVRAILPVNNLIGDFKNQGEREKYVDSDFVLLSAEKIYFVEYGAGVYSKVLEQSVGELMSETGKAEPDQITAGSCFYMNKENPDLKAYARNKEDKVIRLITGHSKGQVVIWEIVMPDNNNFFLELRFHKLLPKSYNKEVMEIIHLDGGIGITTSDSFIHIWDLALKESKKDIDLSSMPF